MQVRLGGEMEPYAEDNGDPIAQAEGLLKDGVHHYEHGGFIKALELWRQAQALLSTPGPIAPAVADDLRAHLAMREGKALDTLGRYEEALGAYARARGLHALPHLATRQEMDSDRARLAIHEGSALQFLGRTEEALVVRVSVIPGQGLR